MDKEIGKLRFASRSHAIEYALAKLKEEKEHEDQIHRKDKRNFKR